MPDRSRQLADNSGFVLLHVLWLLLAATALASSMLSQAVMRSEDVALAQQLTQRALAQESAIELVIHELVTEGSNSRWSGDGSITRELSIHGHSILLSVQNVDGLVDIGSADVMAISALLNSTRNPDNASALAKIVSARAKHHGSSRAFSSYAELQALSGLDAQTFPCIAPFITLFSGRLAPIPELTPVALVKLLGMPRLQVSQESALEDSTIASGSTYRIEAAQVSAGLPHGQILSVEVTITGLIRPSHVIRSWTSRIRSHDKLGC